MKTLKEALSLLSFEEQKEILEGILEELQDVPKEERDKIVNLKGVEKEEVKKKFISKLLSLRIDDENLEKLKNSYCKAD